MARLAAALLAVGSLAGCAATTNAPPPPAPAGTCDAGPAQGLLGRQAGAATGAELLRLTGAKVLRWVPPRTAVTMDFRPDRLTVSYDDTMTIDRIACG